MWMTALEISRTAIKAVLLTSSLLLTLPATTIAAQPARAAQTIEQAANAYREAVLAADAGRVAATYRDDAMEMPPCQPLLRGRAAIEEYYRQLFTAPIKITDFTFSHIETTAAGKFGYTTGTYRRKIQPNSGEPLEESGKFVVIVKRDASGSWKAAYVMYNSDRAQGTPDTSVIALPPPLSALTAYYRAVTLDWLTRIGLVVLALAAAGAGSRFVRRGRSSWRWFSSRGRYAVSA